MEIEELEAYKKSALGLVSCALRLLGGWNASKIQRQRGRKAEDQMFLLDTLRGMPG